MVIFRAVLWHIGDVIRKVRETRGLSRKELASKAGIRQNTLGELERNVSNFERGTLGKVALALQITVDGLYAELPGVKVPPTTDPVDAETVARFLQLERDQKRAVRIMVDQLALATDRQHAPTPAEDVDAPPHPDRVPHKHP